MKNIIIYKKNHSLGPLWVSGRILEVVGLDVTSLNLNTWWSEGPTALSVDS